MSCFPCCHRRQRRKIVDASLLVWSEGETPVVETAKDAGSPTTESTVVHPDDVTEGDTDDTPSAIHSPGNGAIEVSSSANSGADSEDEHHIPTTQQAKRRRISHDSLNSSISSGSLNSLYIHHESTPHTPSHGFTTTAQTPASTTPASTDAASYSPSLAGDEFVLDLPAASECDETMSPVSVPVNPLIFSPPYWGLPPTPPEAFEAESRWPTPGAAYVRGFPSMFPSPETPPQSFRPPSHQQLRPPLHTPRTPPGPPPPTPPTHLPHTPSYSPPATCSAPAPGPRTPPAILNCGSSPLAPRTPSEIRHPGANTPPDL